MAPPTVLICKEHNEERVRYKNGMGGTKLVCRSCGNERSRKYYSADPRRALFQHAKSRAQKLGVPITIRLDDIVIPTHCPSLGIELKIGAGKFHDASPTIDRFKPELGYVPGNIAVISFRANTIKGIGTADEHEKVTAWMRRKHETEQTTQTGC